jgi:hypothetical protein
MRRGSGMRKNQIKRRSDTNTKSARRNNLASDLHPCRLRCPTRMRQTDERPYR